MISIKLNRESKQMKRLFTSESVTSGHPDKICDQISDAILDECLKQDADSRVACEVAIKVSIKQQSPDIAQGVDQVGTLGAGDQGMMFGYATDETEEFMPLSIMLAHKIAKQLEVVRQNGDSGLTGRKVIVDSYGGGARHGSAFSGKDYTKVDRSAAYAARYVAKNIVAAGLAKRCEIQLVYAIGREEPLSVFVETFGTSEHSNEQLADIIVQEFTLSPTGIIKMLQLKQTIYSRTSVYGHFGKDLELPWEKTDRVEILKKYREVV